MRTNIHRFAFVVPFRIPLNLKNEYTFVSKKDVQEVAQQAVDYTTERSSLHIRAQHPADDTPDSPDGQNNAHRLYASLDESHFPPYCKPLAVSYITELYESMALDALTKAFGPGAHRIRDMVIELFDNTIAVFTSEMDIEINPDEIEQIDKFSTELHETIVADLQTHYLSMFYRYFMEQAVAKTLAPKRDEPRVLKDVGDADDVIRTPNTVLWVGRYLRVTEALDASFAEGWTRQADHETVSLSSQTAVDFNIGNSTIVTENGREWHVFLSMIEKGQLYYCTFHITNQNISRIFGERSDNKTGKELQELADGLTEAFVFAGYLTTDWRDFTFGTQGFHRHSINVALETWDMENLIENVQKKADVAHQRVNALIEKKTALFQRVAETGLLFLSGLTLVDIVISLFEFQRTTKYGTQDIYGVLDIIAIIPVDAGIYMAIGVLAVVTLIYYNARSK